MLDFEGEERVSGRGGSVSSEMKMVLGSGGVGRRIGESGSQGRNSKRKGAEGLYYYGVPEILG